MSIKKEEIHYIRPIKKLRLIKKIWAACTQNKMLKYYKIQKKLETSLILGDELEIAKNFLNSNIEEEQNLLLYSQLLLKLKDPNSNLKTIKYATTYNRAVFEDSGLALFKKTHNYSRTFEKAKIAFSKSMRKIELKQLEFVLGPAKKAYKLAPWFSLYAFHVELMRFIEKTDQIYTILSETLVLTRFNKRVKFYNLVKQHLDKTTSAFNAIQFLYSAKNRDVIRNCLDQINQKCIKSIEKDQHHFSLDEEDSAIMKKLLEQYTVK